MERGTRLGQYEILDQLGAGGMGEVYRARDTNLERDVAIKVLPEHVAGDAERLARFEREAKLLAQLNHANIATIHGFEKAGGVHFIAMELVEGQTLGDRIADGGVEVDAALRLARQIALALEAAHAAGVIHRDLKPANVQVTGDGTVKVLDFGLAKAYETDSSAAAVSPDLSATPTMAAATRTGVILGTAAYMSPEQARGGALDGRTDIWSFGCLLFELLAGQRPFRGETISDTLASILKEEPDWDSLPASVPPQVERLARRCLRKEPDKRLHDIADARIEIDEALAEPTEAWSDPSQAIGAPRWRSVLPWGIAVAMTAWALFAASRPNAVQVAMSPTRFTVSVPVAGDLSLALSADGSRLVYAARGEDGEQRLYLREMNTFDAVAIPGTEGARFPFFSPDGQWVGFSTDTSLMKTSLAGGATFPVAGGEGSAGGASWGPDGNIVVQRGFGTGLVLIPADGGEPTALTRVDPLSGERHHELPVFLPGGQAVLYTVLSGINSERHEVAVVSLDGGESKVLTTGRDARYVSTGHLIFTRRNVLMAVPFDAVSLALAGEPRVILGSVRSSTARGARGIYAVAANGTFAYLADATAQIAERELVWVDREGNQELITEVRRQYSMPRLSPDGRQLAVSILEEDRFGVWIYSFARDTLTGVTPDASSGYAVWSPDGRTLAFTSDRAGPIGVFRQPILAGAEVEQLAAHDDTTLAGSWSPDERELLATVIGPDTLGDIAVITLEPPGDLRMLINTDADEYSPQFSPDGRWIAYHSFESGQSAVYVQSYPGLEIKELVGTTDAADGQPLWSRDGRELFYRRANQLMVVSVDLGPEISIGRSRVLFDVRDDGDLEGITGYDIAADGSRFVMIRRATEAVASPEPRRIQVVLNWSEELQRLVPTGR